mmetsp:Transcript_99105/g.296144  ORF Transcript_99105/g.296144 Transcript_99105/m.296144 type:complete len:212 (+) Transcript_99105:123-758(+)
MSLDEDLEKSATAALLLNASGVHRHLFPKTYHTRLTRGFGLHLLSLAVFLFGYTAIFTHMNGLSLPPELVAFACVYLLFLFAFIFCQVPLRVVRENDRILMVFCCRTRAIPIESVLEVRVVRMRKPCHGSFRSHYPSKCFWGYPTNMERNVIIVTTTHCNNYYFCPKEMDEFITDNWPDAQGGNSQSSELRSLMPAVVGKPAEPAMDATAC